MALYLKLDKKQYGKDGLIPLRRGDAWSLLGKVVNRYAGYEEDYDLSDVVGDITGCIENTTGGSIATTVTIEDAVCGKVTIAAEAEATELADECVAGQSMYLLLQEDDGPKTVETLDQPLEILDRGFTNG